MFQPHNPNATASAIIEGLAIAKYNQDESKWEVTFLRNCGHYPKLTIREVDRKSGAVISTLITYEIEEGDVIFITVSNPSGSEGWKYEIGEPFSRDDIDHDSQDLRWMLDINQLSEAKVKRLANPIAVNPLFISDGVFYTSVITKGSYQDRWVDAAGIPTEMKHLGQTGRTFGSDFQGSSVTIEIKGNNGFTETLLNNADIRYELIFDNSCIGEEQPPEGQTDFYYYYRFFDSSDGRVEIFPEIIDFVMDDPDQEPKTPACQSILG